MNETGIGWTGFTWNYPIGGCQKLTPECKFCYAYTFAEDKRGSKAFPFGFDLTMRLHKRDEPQKLLRSRGPQLIFCNSMTDPGLDDRELSGEELQRLNDAGIAGMDDVRDLFFDAIEACPEHRYQVLTKRPLVLLDHLSRRGRKLPPSVWFGVTIGHHSTADRLRALRKARDFGARVLFISAEPLLCDLVGAGLRLDGIDWVITGGESGRHASDPKHEARFLVYETSLKIASPRWVPKDECADWVRAIRDEAARAGCAHFFKQWGGPTNKSGGRVLDGRTHDGMPVHVPGAMPEKYTHKVALPVIH